MGQASCKSCSSIRETPSGTIQPVQELPDLATLPPEVAVQVLSQLDATDLCLAGCVNEFWCSLANVDVLWKGSVSNIMNDSCDEIIMYIIQSLLSEMGLHFSLQK